MSLETSLLYRYKIFVDASASKNQENLLERQLLKKHFLIDSCIPNKGNTFLEAIVSKTKKTCLEAFALKKEEHIF